jgi:uncharacterized protein (TIGR03435 family)
MGFVERMMRGALLSVAAIACCPLGIAAQATAANPAISAVPDYDVAAVNVNNTGSGSSHVDISDDILRATNVQIRSLLEIAFDIRRDQMVGLPHWAQVERYDIVAKVVDLDPQQIRSLSDDQQRIMLQHLLEQRFQLQTHIETRTLPLLKLTVVKDGIKFAEWKKPRDGQESKKGFLNWHNDELTGDGVSIGSLVRFLASQTHMPVIDETSLKGSYNFTLKWQREEEGPASGLHDQALPTIYAALPEQLGLKLESGKGPVKVLVVDHIEQPGEN